MQMQRCTDAFNCGDLAELGDAFHFPGAGANYFAVQDYGTGAANACAASDLGARKAHAPDDRRQIVFLGIAEDESFNAVNR
jgi:hypothetical protein